MGIQYAAHFPKLVHSLESGLGIYEVKLLAGDPHITAAIAGPHNSFNIKLEKVGDAGAMLAAFTQGSDHWKLFEPPPIKSMYPNTKDLELAAALNLAEIRGLDDISEFKNDSTLPTAFIWAEHNTPLAEECVQQPPSAPRKIPKNRGRILTDTREDLLDSYDADDELVMKNML